MKLRSIDIYGLFGCRKHHVVRLSDDHLTYIHSLNGVGKSTSMKLIRDIYKGDVQSLAGTPFDEVTLGFDDGSILRIKNGVRPDITLESEGHISSLTDSDLRLMFSVVYLSAERNVCTMPDGRLISSIDMFSSAFRQSYSDAAEDRELHPYPREKNDLTAEEFTEWCSELEDSLSIIRSIKLIPDMPEDLPFPPTEEQYMASKERYEELAYSLSDWIERHYDFAESLDLFISIINRLFTEKKIVIGDRDQLMAAVDTGDGTFTLPLNKLSAGEKQLIIIFSRILFFTTPGSLVILDEPEISLHVSWQQKIGSILLDIAQLRDLQMIVATHSPMIIHDRWDLASELRSERA